MCAAHLVFSVSLNGDILFHRKVSLTNHTACRTQESGQYHHSPTHKSFTYLYFKIFHVRETTTVCVFS